MTNERRPTAEDVFEPCAGALVLWCAAVVGVEEKVPSTRIISIAVLRLDRSAQTLSSWNPGRRPRSRAAMRNGRDGLISRRAFRPRRRKSFTTSLNERPERRTSVDRFRA